MKPAEEAREVERDSGHRGLRPITAVAVLAVVVVVVGAVGYLVLNAVSHTETKSSTEHSCEPSTSPQCASAASTVGVISHGGAALEAARA